MIHRRIEAAPDEAALAVADELAALADRTDALGAALGQDPATLRRHMTEFQTIDLLTQVQRELATFLRSTLPLADRLAAVRLDELAGRLAERLGT